MIKKEFVARFSAKSSESQKRSKELVEDFLELFGDCLSEEDVLKFSGWGAFEVKYTPKRNVKHPKTQETMVIEGKRVIKFRQGKNLIAAMDFYTEQNSVKEKFSLKKAVKKILKK